MSDVPLTQCPKCGCPMVLVEPMRRVSVNIALPVNTTDRAMFLCVCGVSREATNNADPGRAARANGSDGAGGVDTRMSNTDADAAEIASWQVRDDRTPAERERDAIEDRRVAAWATAFDYAKRTILAKHADGGWLAGDVDCPKCGAVESLAWFMDVRNKHTRGKCRTPGCLEWIE